MSPSLSLPPSLSLSLSGLVWCLSALLGSFGTSPKFLRSTLTPDHGEHPSTQSAGRCIEVEHQSDVGQVDGHRDAQGVGPLGLIMGLSWCI